LKKRGYPTFSKNDETQDASDGPASFDYLVHMPIFTLSLEKINELVGQKNAKQVELQTIKNQTSKDLWTTDLENIRKLL
jgi:hypothetical protein